MVVIGMNTQTNATIRHGISVFMVKMKKFPSVTQSEA